ncbi:L-fucose:H+ symporter permease [Labilibaculum sp. DW002]|uniref:L-fucose:H+ symporter permease n=1 Tax=Paralabilibaculum antarcticum TaxID=2912572 RepID=A0ABT5VPY6_9BACT|nr:L-fucose:H+ symporter permease [Labilibaculum sp. DW002]MDE5417501.1 L-fucose:H+ symporter permease [Labilibaculum sp. DW002]
MSTKDKVVSRAVLIPFVLITFCFALWGFANDITNPMVEAFSRIFNMGASGGTWVQVVFYGGYGAMAFPAALFIRKYTYKAGILVGLGLYATGGLLFLPASALGMYYPFLIAYFVMTCGLSFLETSANPYILSMGADSTATRRLNLAQAFNPMGSLTGMFIATTVIQARLDPRGAEARTALSPAEFEAVKMSDLSILSTPYIAIGLVIIAMFIIIALVKMPKNEDADHSLNLFGTLAKLFKIRKYREGVIAQMFYVGAQIMCWTFIVQYGQRIFVKGGLTPHDLESGWLSIVNSLGFLSDSVRDIIVSGKGANGLTEGAAAHIAQLYNILAMFFFLVARFVCTFMLKYIKPGRLLQYLAIGGVVLATGTIMLQGISGLYCLIGVSACMSLMFPTIYGIALEGMGDDAKFGAAGLIMSIVGGTFLPKIQAAIIDMETVFDMPAVNFSFILPLICFVLIAFYGYRTVKIHMA